MTFRVRILPKGGTRDYWGELQRLKTQAGQSMSPYINVFASSIKFWTLNKTKGLLLLPRSKVTWKTTLKRNQALICTGRQIEKTGCSLSRFLPLIHNFSGGVRKAGGLTGVSPSLGAVWGSPLCYIPTLSLCSSVKIESGRGHLTLCLPWPVSWAPQDSAHLYHLFLTSCPFPVLFPGCSIHLLLISAREKGAGLGGGREEREKEKEREIEKKEKEKEAGRKEKEK